MFVQFVTFSHSIRINRTPLIFLSDSLVRESLLGGKIY